MSHLGGHKFHQMYLHKMSQNRKSDSFKGHSLGDHCGGPLEKKRWIKSQKCALNDVTFTPLASQIGIWPRLKEWDTSFPMLT